MKMTLITELVCDSCSFIVKSLTLALANHCM